MQPIPAMLAGKKTPFSATIPDLQIFWDSTSLGYLKRCPRYYQLRMLHGKETKKGSIHLTFGILYHKCLEAYDKAKALGDSHDEAQHKAVQYGMENSVEHYEAWKCQNCGRRWDLIEHPDYCPACQDDRPNDTYTGFRDLLTGLSQKGRQQLIRSVVWYTEQYKDDALETVKLRDGTAAVELSFTLPLDFGPEGSDETYTLRGHLDRLARNAEGLWIPDRKTTKGMLYDDYFAGFSPHNQVTLYSLAGKAILGEPVNGVIIDAAQVAVNFTRFQRGYTPRTPSQLEEWLSDLQQWLRMAEHYAKTQHWPMNEEACNLYGGCPFRRVCGRSPEVRDKYLENDYVTRVWNPAIDR